MKIENNNITNDILWINKDKKLYYENVYRILVFGKWDEEIKDQFNNEYPGIRVCKTDIEDTILAYMTNDEVLPVIEKIDDFGEYVVLEQMIYDEFLENGFISEEYNEKFKQLVSIINKQLSSWRGDYGI